jgi:hypothetical protein
VKNSLGDIAGGVVLLKKMCPRARTAGRTRMTKYRRHPLQIPIQFLVILKMMVENSQLSDCHQPHYRQWLELDILSQLPFRQVLFPEPSQVLMYWGRLELVPVRLLRSCSPYLNY